MNLHNPGAAFERYRAQTERQAQMPGVTLGSFICCICGHKRQAAGRKQFVKGTAKFGYMCAECHDKRTAKRAEKEAA